MRVCASGPHVGVVILPRLLEPSGAAILGVEDPWGP